MSHPDPATLELPRSWIRIATWVSLSVLVTTAVAATWWRLSHGLDLVDEGFSVLVPWRWALGDRPFVNEENLAQAAGLLTYPFMKAFALISGGDATGVVLFGRHLYLVFVSLVAGSVFIAVRRHLVVGLSLLVALPFFTLILFETPQLTANTLCAGFLAAGAALGCVVVFGGRRRYALVSGVAYGLACVAYPTVIFIVPFVAVFLALALGRRAAATVATGAFLHPPSGDDSATGLAAWRALSAWALGGILVLAPVAGVVVLSAGTKNLSRAWGYSIDLARQLEQLGGAAKAVIVVSGFAWFVMSQWPVLLAAAGVLIAFRLRPGLGRWLLMGTPVAFWVTATTSSLEVAGAVIGYALAAPYLFLFVPPERREDGARVLLWVWGPAVLIGAMAAYTSADGFVRAAVGLYPALLAAALFLAWALQPLGRAGRVLPRAWPAGLCLVGVVAVSLVLQVQFQQGGAAYADLSQRIDAGPWKGIAVTHEQATHLERFSAALDAQARDGDELLIYPLGAGHYLYWSGAIAANTYQMHISDPGAPLPKATVSYFKRHRQVPTLVVRLADTGGLSEAQLRAGCCGLDYPAVAVDPRFSLHRKPAGESVRHVLDGRPAPD